MADRESQASTTAASWDTYWHGAGDAAAYSDGGTSHPLVLSFWRDFFAAVRERYDAPRIVDIASGNGAVARCARSAFDGPLGDFTCVDISASAIEALQQRYPEIKGIVADARSVPLESGEFDVATSQFGIEYAGLDAIDEMVRLVAPGGRLALLLHHKTGGIYRQCEASLEAVRTMQEARFIPLAMTMFGAGFAALRGGDRAAYDAATKEFIPALRRMETIMGQHGQHVADGTIVKLYRDVRDIHGRMTHYEPTDVLGWLGNLQAEVEAYAGRMESMCRAAIESTEFDSLCERVRGRGFELSQTGPLTLPDRDIPLAWKLVARRS